MEKRYYWLKMSKDFFNDKKIKKLRKIAGGDTYTIIYLKMQLLSIESGGVLHYDGVEDNFAEELALELDEDGDNVGVTLALLKQLKLIEDCGEDEIMLVEAARSIGSETQGAERVRKLREKQKNVTPALQECYIVQDCNADVMACNKTATTDIDIDKEIDIEIDKEIDKDKKHRDREGGKAPDGAPREVLRGYSTSAGETVEPRKRLRHPTVEEVAEYCKERNNAVDAQRFVDYYDSNGWKVGKNPMKDWKASVRTWERNAYLAPRGDKPNEREGRYCKPSEEYERDEAAGLPF